MNIKPGYLTTEFISMVIYVGIMLAGAFGLASAPADGDAAAAAASQIAGAIMAAASIFPIGSYIKGRSKVKETQLMEVAANVRATEWAASPKL